MGCSENRKQQPGAFSLIEKEPSVSKLGDEEIRRSGGNCEDEKNTTTSGQRALPHNVREVISDLSVKRSSEDLLIAPSTHL